MSDEQASKELVLSSKADHIAIIKINRPKALNALSGEVYEGIFNAINECSADPDVHVVVIKGDKNFAAGADIGSMATADPISVQNYVQTGLRCIRAVYECEVPVIAQLCGYVLGGGLELALSCDIRVAAQNTHLGLPEITLGIIPGNGGTQRLAKLIGTGQAKELIMTGDIIDADKAMTLGILNHVYQNEEYEAETMKLAKKLAARPLQAVKRAKLAVNASNYLDIYHGLQFESSSFYTLFSTQDQKEGMRAFLEKRKPQFVGK